MIPEAVGAVYGTVVGGLEWDLGIFSAFGANNIVHRAVFVIPTAGTSCVTPGIAVFRPAAGAAAGFIGEPFFGKEGLL